MAVHGCSPTRAEEQEIAAAALIGSSGRDLDAKEAAQVNRWALEGSADCWI